MTVEEMTQITLNHWKMNYPGEDKEDKASDGQGKGRGVDNAAGGGVREDDTLRDEHNQDRNSNDGRRSVGGVEKPVHHLTSAGPGGT